MPKPDQNQKLDRHSGTGTRGLAKKEGHAAKGGWGKAGTGEDGEATYDKNDPNYMSDEDEESLVLSKVELASPSVVLINEYLFSGDIQETAKSLLDLPIQLRSHFVKKSIFIAMEKSAYERELISLLLASSSVYAKSLTSFDIEDGFQQALDSLDDASLDIPDATDILAKFLARAVVDEIIPPKFLSIAGAPSQKAQEALRIAAALTTENHGCERLAHIWGPGDLRSVKRLKNEVNLILQEYLTTGDAEEAERCVRKLNAPSFFFQIVRQALRLALDKNDENTTKKITSLLSKWAKIGFISEDQFKRGFAVCYENLPDIKLDVPAAETVLKQLTETAKNEGYLPKDFNPPPPRVTPAAAATAAAAAAAPPAPTADAAAAPAPAPS